MTAAAPCVEEREEKNLKKHNSHLMSFEEGREGGDLKSSTPISCALGREGED